MPMSDDEKDAANAHRDATHGARGAEVDQISRLRRISTRYGGLSDAEARVLFAEIDRLKRLGTIATIHALRTLAEAMGASSFFRNSSITHALNDEADRLGGIKS